jgi:hypothetical protein
MTKSVPIRARAGDAAGQDRAGRSARSCPRGREPVQRRRGYRAVACRLGAEGLRARAACDFVELDLGRRATAANPAQTLAAIVARMPVVVRAISADNG